MRFLVTLAYPWFTRCWRCGKQKRGRSMVALRLILMQPLSSMPMWPTGSRTGSHAFGGGQFALSAIKADKMRGSELLSAGDMNDVHGAKGLRAGVAHANALRGGIHSDHPKSQTRESWRPRSAYSSTPLTKFTHKIGCIPVLPFAPAGACFLILGKNSLGYPTSACRSSFGSCGAFHGGKMLFRSRLAMGE